MVKLSIKKTFLISLTLEDGKIGNPETSVLSHLTPRNNPEDGRIHFNRCGSIKLFTLLAPSR
jgi:hypothetical protein